MITRKVSLWTKEKIADALNTFAGAGGGIRFAYFYMDRVVMTARPLRDTRGLVTKVTKDEIITDGDAVVGRVRAAMHGALLLHLRALEEAKA